jgi:hypothetical protein
MIMDEFYCVLPQGTSENPTYDSHSFMAASLKQSLYELHDLHRFCGVTQLQSLWYNIGQFALSLVRI